MGTSHKQHGRIWVWFDHRIGLAELEELAKKKEVPVHRHTLWYYFGGMTLFLFLIQVTTGILLLFYYRPSAEEAYESVRFLMAEVEFGWLIRSIHAWAANLMIFTLFVHLFSVWLLKAYRPPRELTWLSGVVLMVLALGFGFTGYLLPWNELAYFATKVGSLTTLLLSLHLFLVQKHGMSVPPAVERMGGLKRAMPFFPNFFLRDLVGWLSALVILASLAAYLPAELGQKADPFAPAPVGIKPEWYFMFMFQTLKYLPSIILGIEGEVIGVVGFAVGGLFLLLIPFLDQRTARGEPSRLFTGICIAVILYMLVLTYLGYTMSPGK